LSRGAFLADDDGDSDTSKPNNRVQQDRRARRLRRLERKATRAARRAGREGRLETVGDRGETKSAAEVTDPD
jgi:hypothetical protein